MTTRMKLAAAVLALGTLAAGIRTFTFADEKPARLDPTGDPLPVDAVARLGTLRWRHSSPVSWLTYTPDGKQVITATPDGVFRVLEADSGKEVRRFGRGATRSAEAEEQKKRAVMARPEVVIHFAAAALSPDGKTLAAGTQDGAITFYDVATGKEGKVIKPNPPVAASLLLFAPDGKSLIARNYDPILRQYDVAEGKELRQFGEAFDPNKRVNLAFTHGGVALSADGKALRAVAFQFDNNNNQVTCLVKSWELATGKEQPAIKGPQVQGGVSGAALAPDGKVVAWGSFNGTVHIWDVAAGKELRQLNNEGYYTLTMTFAPDGKTLAVRTGEQSVRLWDVAAGKPLHKFADAPPPDFGGGTAGSKLRLAYGWVQCNLAFAPEGGRVATGNGARTVRQWEVKTGKEAGLAAGGHPAEVLDVALSADGQAAVTRSGFSAHLWDVAAGKENGRLALPAGAHVSALSASGALLAVGCGNGVTDGWVSVFDVKAAREVKQWKTTPQPARAAPFSALAITPDGKTVATRYFDLSIQLWDAGTGRMTQQVVAAESLQPGQRLAFKADRIGPDFLTTPQLVFSPDGTALAGMAADNAPTGKNAYRYGNGLNALRLWDVATGKTVRKFDPADGMGVAALIFAPDGRTIFTAEHGMTVTCWEAASGKVRSRFTPAAAEAGAGKPGAGAPAPTPPAMATCLAVSPNGRLLACGTAEGAVLFWDVTTGKVVGRRSGHLGPVVSVAFSGDGKRLVSGGSDTTALVWEVSAVSAEKAPALQVEAKQVELLWDDLAGADAVKAYQAIRVLSQVPRQAVPLLKERVQALLAPDPAKVAQLVADLDSNAFAKRKKAEDELEKMGELAEDALKQALAGKPGLEMQKRLEGLLAKLLNGSPPSPHQLRALRALEVLETAGTPEAREVLQGVAKGAPGARVTRDARAALERLGGR